MVETCWQQKATTRRFFPPLVRPGGLSCWLAICPTCMFILCCLRRQLQRASLFRRVKKTKTLFPFLFGRSVFRTRPLHLLGASSSSSCLCFPPVSRVCVIFLTQGWPPQQTAAPCHSSSSRGARTPRTRTCRHRPRPHARPARHPPRAGRCHARKVRPFRSLFGD